MTAYDPFNTAPQQPAADEPPFEPDPAPAPVQETAPAPVQNAPAARPVAAESDGKIVTTLKAGIGYDAPWVVIHANSIAESDAILDQQFAAYLDKVKRVATYFHGGPAPQQGAQAQQQPAQTPPQQQAPGGGGKTCAHGAMQFRSGVSNKTGQPWQAYFCPTPKGTPGQCKAEFIRN